MAVAHPGEASINNSCSVVQSILAAAQEQRFIIEDFRPLAESLEWDLGQRYLRERGSRAFLRDSTPIPFVINNDGVLSRQAAELLFTSLVEAEKEKSKVSEIKGVRTL